MSKDTLRVDDIDLMVSPDGCWDVPHEACADWGIPIIFVRENKNIYEPHSSIKNYLHGAPGLAGTYLCRFSKPRGFLYFL